MEEEERERERERERREREGFRSCLHQRAANLTTFRGTTLPPMAKFFASTNLPPTTTSPPATVTEPSAAVTQPLVTLIIIIQLPSSNGYPTTSPPATVTEPSPIPPG